jgi:hypothetical protein
MTKCFFAFMKSQIRTFLLVQSFCFLQRKRFIFDTHIPIYHDPQIPSPELSSSLSLLP